MIEKAIERMLSRFADDKKLRGEIGNTLEDQLKVQRIMIDLYIESFQ